MSTFTKVWVFSDIASRLPELVAGASRLGGNISAFVIGAPEEAAKAQALGVDTVLHLGEAVPGRIVEDYADTMAAAMAAAGGRSLLLVPATRRCKALASQLGVRLNAGVITEASEITAGDDGVRGRRMVYGGLALGLEKITSPLAIVVVGSGVFSADAGLPAKSGEVVALDYVRPKAPVTCLERRPKQGSSVDLNKAKRIVSVGRGIAKQEDLKMAEELCAAIDAELGCSRPIAEGEKWMERERYVGISGVMPKPELYLALGISGQIQHMVGANGAQTIVAVNKDKKAPIFQYADYGLVGDLYKVVPALISALKG
ncbi:FAD-binding protein [Desulfovibrio aminophilus]|nr:FAD-binding protein [Desulfovibrio aminophilus]MCM0755325.1 FAD-binding protein [Desulfovibrio aminophilus]